MQYPMNLAKVEASEVLVLDNHVFFLMLGAFDENPDATEGSSLEFAKEQVQIGINGIKDLAK